MNFKGLLRLALVSGVAICWMAFAAQALTIYDVQFTEEPGGESPYVGQTVELEGVVSGVYPDLYVIAEDSGAWHGVAVYDPKGHAPDLGDQIWVWQDNTATEFYWLQEDISWNPIRNGIWWNNRTATNAVFQFEPGRAYFYRQHDGDGKAGGATNVFWIPPAP